MGYNFLTDFKLILSSCQNFSKSFFGLKTSTFLYRERWYSKMVQTRAGKETVPQHSDSEAEGMDSPKSVRGQGQNKGDDIDPAMYGMFQKMMARMMSEQAEANLKEAVPKSKLKKKPVKKQVRIIRKKVQPDTTSEESESDRRRIRRRRADCLQAESSEAVRKDSCRRARIRQQAQVWDSSRGPDEQANEGDESSNQGHSSQE